MREMPVRQKNLSSKIILLLAASLLFVTNCQNLPIKSQTKSADETPHKMKDKTENLSEFKWKNRIVLVRETGDAGLNQLREAAGEIKDRDVVWFRLKNGALETNFGGELSENFAENLENEYFEKFEADAFLIGKDGTVKSKDEKLDLKNYFEQLDSMPMRQREMREN